MKKHRIAKIVVKLLIGTERKVNDMPRYIDEKDVYKLVEPRGTARVHCSQIDELPRADVVPKSEVEKLKIEIEEVLIMGSFDTLIYRNLHFLKRKIR